MFRFFYAAAVPAFHGAEAANIQRPDARDINVARRAYRGLGARMRADTGRILPGEWPGARK